MGPAGSAGTKTRTMSNNSDAKEIRDRLSTCECYMYDSWRNECILLRLMPCADFGFFLVRRIFNDMDKLAKAKLDKLSTYNEHATDSILRAQEAETKIKELIQQISDYCDQLNHDQVFGIVPGVYPQFVCAFRNFRHWSTILADIVKQTMLNGNKVVKTEIIVHVSYLRLLFMILIKSHE